MFWLKIVVATNVAKFRPLRLNFDVGLQRHCLLLSNVSTAKANIWFTGIDHDQHFIWYIWYWNSVFTQSPFGYIMLRLALRLGFCILNDHR
jgi:hypothetical protein